MRHLWAVAAMLLLWTSPAPGQPPRIGVAAESPKDPARTRIIQELEAQGYEVRELEPGDGASGLSARLLVRNGRIEVTVTARRDGALERREAVIALGSQPASTATTRALEFLRASLVEIGVEPVARNPEAARPSNEALPAADRKLDVRRASPAHELSLGAGAGVLHSPGGLSPLAMFVPSMSWRMRAPLRIRLQGMIPLSSAQVSGPEGSVSFRPTVLGLWASWLPARSEWVEPYVEAGLNAVAFAINATNAGGYSARDSTRFLSNVMVSGGVVLFPRARVSVGLSGLLGAGLQQEHVNFGERRAAEWGAWFAGGIATLELGLD